MKQLLVAATAAAVAVSAPHPSEACSCAPPPPACEAMWGADAVFTGKVTQLAPATGGVERATFKVSETLRGTPGFTVVVNGGGMCGATFSQGEEYLVYAHADGSGGFHASLCSRTRHLADAADDLAYAHNPPKRSEAVVEGDVALYDGSGRVALDGVEVTARGTKSVARSDANGHYKLSVAPGKYTLDASKAGYRVLWDRLATIDIASPAQCARRNLDLSYDGHVQGRVTDAHEQPVEGVTVSAAALPDTHAWRLDARTDKTGAYDIHGVPPGAYRLVVSDPDLGGVYPESPFPTTYHPGVAAAGKATVVRVAKSATVSKIDFALPAPLDVFEVDVVVRRTTGGAVAPGVHVAVDNTTYNRETGDKTDDKGHFTTREVAGSTIELRVCNDPPSGQPACATEKRTVDKALRVELVVPR